MALIKCPECGKEISDRAVSCPHCGFPIAGSEISHASSEDTSVDVKSDSVAEAKVPEPQKKSKKMSTVGSSAIVAGVIFVVVLAIMLFVTNLANKPKYSGYPQEVAKEVGALSLEDPNGPRVQITAEIFMGTVNAGESIFFLRNPITGEISGAVHLKSPTDRSYSGTVTVVGTAWRCDGFSDIDLTDAEIVSGG